MSAALLLGPENMSFSSPGFLFAFLPIFFIGYFFIPTGLQNAFLLVGSLAFYSVDGGLITVVLLASIVVNHILGKLIDRSTSQNSRLALLAAGIVLNFVPLLYYKYWNFFLSVVSDVRVLAGDGRLSVVDIVLPAGISFFTFQGLSYLVDIYRREVRPAQSIVDFGMYHTLFPQLVAGPIVRYSEVENNILSRPNRLEDIEYGIIRFCIGLAKKMVIADSMGAVADRMFGLGADQLTMAAAWLGALAYTLQIFFDFSGYSDMAIGLGRALGFRFPENFDQPYTSRSITEFWRRWHMTLSRWFRDYLYIPLGGNRCGPVRTFLNLFAVFVLCGLWHGAAYTFVIWGIYHGALLVIEKLNKNSLRISVGLLRWPLTLLLVVVGWVLFRAETLSQAGVFLRAMVGLGTSTSTYDIAAFVTPDKGVFFVVGALLSLWPSGFRTRAEVWVSGFDIMRPVRQVGALLLFVYSASLMAANGFNPFIYFRF
jgi:alginate O-acetyltransferase complex protein AlgI